MQNCMTVLQKLLFETKMGEEDFLPLAQIYDQNRFGLRDFLPCFLEKRLQTGLRPPKD